jgi:hypothetical protein
MAIWLLWCCGTHLSLSSGTRTMPGQQQSLVLRHPQHLLCRWGGVYVSIILMLSSIMPASRLSLCPVFAVHGLICQQVCLAAETCGHVDFNMRGDVWYSSEPFHCGDVPPGHVTYWQIFQKVGALAVQHAGTAAASWYAADAHRQQLCACFPAVCWLVERLQYAHA